jgi:hypothetical protein
MGEKSSQKRIYAHNTCTVVVITYLALPTGLNYSKQETDRPSKETIGFLKF